MKQVCVYLFLRRGLNHLPPVISEMRMNAMAIHVKILFSAENPMTKKTNPRMRKMLDLVRLF
jgi:hypothetical protein